MLSLWMSKVVKEALLRTTVAAIWQQMPNVIQHFQRPSQNTYKFPRSNTYMSSKYPQRIPRNLGERFPAFPKISPTCFQTGFAYCSKYHLHRLSKVARGSMLAEGCQSWPKDGEEDGEKAPDAELLGKGCQRLPKDEQLSHRLVIGSDIIWAHV